MQLGVRVVSTETGGTKGLNTIEDAETFAEDRGIKLTNKTEDDVFVLAQRSFDYDVGEVDVSIHQFGTAEAAESWAEVLTSSGEQIVVNGRVAFQVCCGPDADEQKILVALK